MSTTNGKRILLADIEAPIEPVVLPDGTEVAVRPLDYLGYQILREYRETGDDLLMWKLVGLCIPDASEAQVQRLTATQISMVTALASRQVDLVNQLLGKERPATAKGGSKSKTRTATPSAGSP